MSFDRDHLSAYNPSKLFTVDQFTITGDSIAVGAGESGQTEVVPFEVAWSVYSNLGSNVSVIKPLDETNAIGGDSAWVYFAEDFFDLTGRRSVWDAYATSGSAITRTSTANSHWDYEFPTWNAEDGGHRLFDPDGNQVAEAKSLIQRGTDALTFDKKYLIYAGGSYDARALTEGRVTKQHITDKLVEAFEWWRDNHGYHKMLIFESGVIGLTEAAADADQLSNRDMIGLREAQNDACAHDDIINVYSHCAAAGDPFNTITSDANGRWASGHQNKDEGGHYHADMAEIMGRTAAWNLAVTEGYVEGSII